MKIEENLMPQQLRRRTNTLTVGERPTLLLGNQKSQEDHKEASKFQNPL